MEIWHNPSCSKCAAATDRLDAAGVGYRLRPYLEDRPTAAEITEVLRRLGKEPWDVCRTGEAFDALGLGGRARDETTRDDWIAALADHPELIQRPILLFDDGRALIARTPEALDEAVREP